MSEKSGFTTMAGAAAEDEAPEVGVGMLGYAFMGKAHSNAFKTIPYMMYPPPAVPKLVSISGRNPAGVEEAAKRFGYAKHTTDWREQIDDPEVQLFDNGGPNDNPYQYRFSLTTHQGPLDVSRATEQGWEQLFPLQVCALGDQQSGSLPPHCAALWHVPAPLLASAFKKGNENPTTQGLAHLKLPFQCRTRIWTDS